MIVPAEKIFPSILIALDIAAAVVYMCKKNSWMAIYWISAAMLTFTVTFKP